MRYILTLLCLLLFLACIRADNTLLETSSEECGERLSQMLYHLQAKTASIFNSSYFMNSIGQEVDCAKTSQIYTLVQMQGRLESLSLMVEGSGEYFAKGSYIGLCVPSLCTEKDITKVLTPFLTFYSLSQGYLNVSLSFEFVKSNELTATTYSNLRIIPLVLLIASGVFGLYGILIEFTQIGNRRDIAIIDTINSIDYKMWNRKLMLQKEEWALFFMAFSPIRNTLSTIGKRRKRKEYQKPTFKSQKSIENLIIADGIRGICIVLICFGMTYDVARYYIITNDAISLKVMTQSLPFTQFVSFGSYTAIELLMFLSGFNQAIAYLQGTNSKPKFFSPFVYSFKRLFKLEVSYIFHMLAILYVLKYAGTGLTKYGISQQFKHCHQNWYGNLLFFNNFTGDFGSRDSMCLPWTWFLSVYAQLTIIAPLVVYLLTKHLMIFYPLVFLSGFICAGVCAIQIFFYKTGIFAAYDDLYWQMTYTKPWQHFVVYIGLGVSFGIFFNSYIEKRRRIDEGDRHENSLGYTILKFIKKKVILRIIINVIGLCLFFGTNILAWLQLNKADPGIAGQLIFAIMRPIVQQLGFIMLLLPLMLSKSKFLRYFLKLRGFLIISQLSFGLTLWYPLICLTFMYSSNQLLTVNLISMCFCFCSSFIISLTISYIGFILVEGPMSSLAGIYTECREVRDGSKTFKFRFLEISRDMLPSSEGPGDVKLKY